MQEVTGSTPVFSTKGGFPSRLFRSMPLSAPLTERLSQELTAHVGQPVAIEQDVPVGGGSINDCYRLETTVGPFFVKVNQADMFPDFFAAEADGLRRLHATGAMRVPAIIGVGDEDDDAFLLLEFIEGGIRSVNFWERFGQQMAMLHRNTAPHFGLERDNYIGSMVQTNAPCDSWAEFFITQRLEPLVKKAREQGRLGDGDVLRFERLFLHLPALFPQEPPALLHGDLWHGNFLCDANSAPVLIDPAVHYGHREMDLAMSRLFGGFDEEFYSAYDEAWPLASGWQERVDLCNLYPLLVHAILFGGGYAQQVKEILVRLG